MPINPPERRDSLPRLAGLLLAGLMATIGPGTHSAGGKSPAGSAEDSSFVILGVPPERAAAIAAHAEAVRSAIRSRLGMPPATAWRPRCEVHVHQRSDTFRLAVGIPPQVARGATSLEFAGDRVSLRRIDVMGDGLEVIPESLSHELVHVVLGDRFIEVPPPRWADEGLALLFDSDAIRRRHETDFRAVQRGRLDWRLRDLFALELDPGDLGRQRVFYGQSGSVVGWLLSRGDAPALLDFMEDAAHEGHAVALQRHYGFESIEACERAWRTDLAARP